MSVEQRNIIDAAGASRTDGHIILTISDHLPFNNRNDRLQTLQHKINDYLDFIETGQIYEAYPSARGQILEISIRFLHTPDPAGRAFLERAAKFVAEAGYSLTFLEP